jgi:hypothetical protein
MSGASYLMAVSKSHQDDRGLVSGPTVEYVFPQGVRNLYVHRAGDYYADVWTEKGAAEYTLKVSRNVK